MSTCLQAGRTLHARDGGAWCPLADSWVELLSASAKSLPCDSEHTASPFRKNIAGSALSHCTKRISQRKSHEHHLEPCAPGIAGCRDPHPDRAAPAELYRRGLPYRRRNSRAVRRYSPEMKTAGAVRLCSITHRPTSGGGR